MTINIDMGAAPANEALPVSNRPETILGVTIAFFCIACVAVSLRMYVRFKSALWGWDDVFVILAAIVVAIGGLFVCLMPGDGLGKHFNTLSDSDIISYFKHVWLANLTYCAGTTLIKIAILMQYLRLFEGQRLARQLVWTLITIIAMWGAVFTLLSLFSCRPIEKNWNFLIPGKCVAWGSKEPNVFYATWMGHASSNMFLDIVVLTCPLPFIRSLRMSGRTKIGLITLFSMGGIVVMISIARVVSLSIRRAGTVPTLDMTWVTPNVYIFSVLEVNVAILTASVPIFWPYVTSLAMNKILIVNEIEIRSESRNDDFALVEQAKSPEGFVSVGDTGPNDKKPSKRPALGVNTLQRSGSRLVRSHRQKPSASSGDSCGVDLGSRPSQDSERNLQLSHQSSNKSFYSANRGDVSPLEGSPGSTRARYKDRYEQDWAVPDFDKGAPVGVDRPTYTTTVERAEIPYDHIKAFEN